MRMFVAYEEGVYRHDTIAFGESEESLIGKILEYFIRNDDYHSIIVEVLDTSMGVVEEICEFRIETSYSAPKEISMRNIYRRAYMGEWEVYEVCLKPITLAKGGL